MNKDLQDDLPTQIDTLIGAEPAGSPEQEENLIGQDLGPFRIRRKLGEGGMGQVYLARQMQPVERDVALKLVLRKVQNARALARFDIEQQALAQMSHPAIAQVYDAGTTPSGYPYFAMEFVDGEPLDHYCHRHRLDLNERLRLLIRICLGVQHAHERGIIHRDLKPGNILITTIDGVPRPKIIDFGIARATEDSEGDAAARDIVGTPQYMSPEQFNLDAVTLDPRSDVYSLGVVLHELLVGCPPIEGEQLSRQDHQTLSQVFADHLPLPAPSTRLGQDASADQALAAERGTSIRKLRQRLKTDLDAITLKALAPAREDRYSSPQALADDIDRALTLHPVRAMPDTRAYRMTRFIQRNKLAVGSTSAIALALLAGLTAATLGMLEAQRQYQIAEQRQAELEQVSRFQQTMLEDLDPQTIGLTLLGSVREQYADSLEADQLESGMATLETLLLKINATDIARDIVDEQLLTKARESIDEQFSDQPLVRADLLESIGAVYQSIGRSEAGLALRGQVVDIRSAHLPAAHIDLLKARNAYGYAYFADDQLEQAESVLTALMDAIDTTDPEARKIYARARNDMALVRVDQGRIDDALELAQNPPDFVSEAFQADADLEIESFSNRGYVLARARRIDEALIEFQKALDQARALRGPDHPTTLRAMTNVSASFGATGRYADALAIETELLDRLIDTNGRQHVTTIRVMSNMANNLRRVGREAEAMALLEEARDTSLALLGPLNPVTLRIRLNLGSLMTQLGALDEAFQILDAVVDDRATVFGPDHPETLSAMEVRVSNLHKQGRFGEGLAMIDPVIEGRIAAFGADHPIVADTRWLKALLQRDIGQVSEALIILQPQAEASFEEAPRANRTLSRAVDLYQALLLSDDRDAADEWYRRALAWLESTDPATLEMAQERIRSRLLALPNR